MSDPTKRRQRLIRWSKHREDERRAELRPIEERTEAARDASRAATVARAQCEQALRAALQSRAAPEELVHRAEELARAERAEVQARRLRVAWEAKLEVVRERVDLARRDRRALENWSERLSASEVARATKLEETELSELARLGRLHREERVREQRALEQGALRGPEPQARIGA